MSDQKVYVTRTWPGEAFQRLEEAGLDVFVWQEFDGPPVEELHQRVKGCAVLVTMVGDRVDAALMDAAGPNLRVIAQAGAGVDNIDLEAARQRGITVTNAPGVLADATADLAFALLCAVARRIVAGQKYVDAGAWTGWHPELLLGPELHGATVGVVGFGGIGKAFARRCRGFDMTVLYNATSPKPQTETEGAIWRELDDLLAESDFVSLHVPLTPETDGLMNRERLRQMQPGSILVNTARGRVVDTEALMEVLREGHLGGAGLDVTEPEPLPARHPLLQIKNVVVTPHIGSAGERTRAKMAHLAVDNALAVLIGKEPPNRVV